MKFLGTVPLLGVLCAMTNVAGTPCAGATPSTLGGSPNVVGQSESDVRVAAQSNYAARAFPLDKAGAAADLSLAVEITGLRNNSGQVGAALYSTAKGFPEKDREFRGAVSPVVREKRVRVEFHGLSAGTYAVAILHDENANGEMDFNLIGIPKEGFGFSNDAEVVLGPPSFQDAAFKLKLKRSKIKITAKYLL